MMLHTVQILELPQGNILKGHPLEIFPRKHLLSQPEEQPQVLGLPQAKLKGSLTGDFSKKLYSDPAGGMTSGTKSCSSTGKQTNGSVSGEHTKKPGGTTSGPGTSTGKQSERSSTGDFSQETPSVPARDTASEPANSKGTSQKPSSGPEEETCSVKGLLSKDECEEMISNAQVLFLGQKNLRDPEEQKAYLRQILQEYSSALRDGLDPDT